MFSLMESFNSWTKTVTEETILLSTSRFQMGFTFAEFNLRKKYHRTYPHGCLWVHWYSHLSLLILQFNYISHEKSLQSMKYKNWTFTENHILLNLNYTTITWWLHMIHRYGHLYTEQWYCTTIYSLQLNIPTLSINRTRRITMVVGGFFLTS